MLKIRIPQVLRIPQYRNFRLELPKYRMKNCPIPQYRKPQCPPLIVEKALSHNTTVNYTLTSQTSQMFFTQHDKFMKLKIPEEHSKV